MKPDIFRIPVTNVYENSSYPPPHPHSHVVITDILPDFFRPPKILVYCVYLLSILFNGSCPDDLKHCIIVVPTMYPQDSKCDFTLTASISVPMINHRNCSIFTYREHGYSSRVQGHLKNMTNDATKKP